MLGLRNKDSGIFGKNRWASMTRRKDYQARKK